MTRICVDARMINNSGIGVYTRKYIECLLNERSFDVVLIGNKKDLKSYFGPSKNWLQVETDVPIYSIREQIKLPLSIPPCDVFWSPHYNIPIFPIKARRRLVTIPDVFHLAHLDTLSVAQRIYATVVTKAAAWWSDKILTISKFSEQEIIRLTGTNNTKIKTIHLGLDANLFRYIGNERIQRQVRDRYQLPKQYILFVGNVKPNKNLRSLVGAFAKLADEMPDLYLLIAGKKEGFITGDSTIFDQIGKENTLMNRIVFSGFIASEDLPVLYSMAHVFAFPSLYEGFGFPPLEAMACLCPVVASDRASIPEICGDAALYIDPTSTDELANGIRKVLTDRHYREKLIANGVHKIKEYDWVNSQHQFMQEIRQLANNR